MNKWGLDQIYYYLNGWDDKQTEHIGNCIIEYIVTFQLLIMKRVVGLLLTPDSHI